MMKTSMMRAVCCAVAAVGLWAGGARGQALVERVPGDAIVYAGWAGSQALAPAYGGSHLKAVVDATSWGELVEKKLPAMLEKAGAGSGDARKVKEVLGLAGVMWKYPTALYVGKVEMGPGRPPMPRVAVICEAGADAEKVAGQVEKMLAEAGRGPVPVKVKREGGVVALVVGELGAAEGVIFKKEGEALVANAAFKAAAAQVQKAPALMAYVDVAGIVKQTDELMVQAPEGPRAKWGTVRDALGLPGITGVAMTTGFEGKDWAGAGFVGLSGPRTGIAALFDGKPVTDEQFKIVPGNATWAIAGRMDVGKLWDEVAGVVGKIGAQEGREMERGIAQMNRTAGFDVRKELIGALGDQWTAYASPTVGGTGIFGTTIVCNATDEAKLAASVEKLDALINRQMPPARAGSFDPKMRVLRSEMGGVKVSSISLFIVTPSWAVHGGRLYLSLVPQAIPSAVAAAAGGKGSLLESEKFLAVRKRLGVEKATSITYVDMPAALLESYPWLSQVMSLVTMMAGEDAPPSLLPPLNKLLPELAPCGGAAWSDEKGWHCKSFSPMPGSTVLGCQQTIGMTTPAVLMGIMLPSLGKARELSNRSVEAANLRGVGQSCAIWANDHQDQFPQHLAQLVADGSISPKSLVTKRSSTQAAVLTAEQIEAMGKDWRAIEKVIDDHCDIVYLGRGMKSETDASMVLAYIDPAKADPSGGMNLVFQDCHCEWVPPYQLAETFRPLNEKRKKLGLKEVDVGALVQGAGMDRVLAPMPGGGLP